jgi:pimeloyl-ACP methyl ester carboxylesterase
VVGFSLGGFITGLVACVENRIDFAMPIIASGNLIKGMWDKPLIRRIRSDLDTAGVTEAMLAENWRIISPVNFTPKLPPCKIQVIAGLYDILIPVRNVEDLHEKWNRPRLKWLPCGHVSIGICPRGLVRTIVDFIKGLESEAGSGA